MQVQRIQNNGYTPQFKSWGRVVYHNIPSKADYAVKHRNTTSFFRRDMDWPALTKFLVDKYKDVSKVNTYCYGCSNGAEPYSLLIQLYSRWPELVANKFMPIIAKDYDAEAIKVAKAGIVPIEEEELAVVKAVADNREERFLDYVEKTDFGEYLLTGNVWKMRYNKGYANKMDFSVADIRNDYKNIAPENSVVFARNFLPYLNTPDLFELLRHLGEQMKQNSCLIIGAFDETDLMSKRGIDIEELLSNAGFIKADDYLKYVYTKH